MAAPPTMDDVAGLTPQSDFAPFAAPGVDPKVRNAALRKLFLTDPHFRSHDGLDVSNDEVMELASSPLARQHKILQARAMGMLDDDLLDQANAETGQNPNPPEPD